MADGRFETSRFMATDLRDVSGIDAEDEFPFRVSRRRQLASMAVLRVNPVNGHAQFFVFLQPLANG
jgi:hypothetical protein